MRFSEWFSKFSLIEATSWWGSLFPFSFLLFLVCFTPGNFALPPKRLHFPSKVLSSSKTFFSPIILRFLVFSNTMTGWKFFRDYDQKKFKVVKFHVIKDFAFNLTVKFIAFFFFYKDVKGRKKLNERFYGFGYTYLNEKFKREKNFRMILISRPLLSPFFSLFPFSSLPFLLDSLIV